MAEEERKISLHGTVKEKAHYKSYRVESTPIQNTIYMAIVYTPMYIYYDWKVSEGLAEGWQFTKADFAKIVLGILFWRGLQNLFDWIRFKNEPEGK